MRPKQIGTFSKNLVVSIVLLLVMLGHSSASAEEQQPLAILAYHEVTDRSSALIPDYSVDPTTFVRHIDWLLNNGYHFVTVDQVMAARAGRASLPHRPVLLTFDDGYTSVYEHAWPILRMLGIPAVIAVVTRWQEESSTVDFGGKAVPRKHFMTWEQLREMQVTGLVEIASHSHDLHRGILGNPGGSMQAAATTRLYDSGRDQYESESAYRARIDSDLRRANKIIRQRVGKSPRVMVWPYGRFNGTAAEVAAAAGMTIGLTLDDGANDASVPPFGLRRILIESKTNIGELRYQLRVRASGVTENDRAQKVAHVDLDYIYDSDPAQFKRNLNHLVDRLTWLGVNTVYLQAFADPDANGSASETYFSNRHLPVRANVFGQVAWEIRTRTPVKRVYAWMPLLAWELPEKHPVAGHKVVALAGASQASVSMAYKRLTPFSADARKVILEIFEDLARYNSFEGIIFHDDITLSDHEDASPEALAQYRGWGLPDNIASIRASDDLLGRWTLLKINYLDAFAREAIGVVRRDKPSLYSARNLYAQVVLEPRAEVWYSQSLENSLRNYDFTAIMAMPYMENAQDPLEFQRALLKSVERFPDSRRKVIFELQTVDWRHQQALIPTEEIVRVIEMLYEKGVRHVAYYPDMMFQSHPEPARMREVFSKMSADPELPLP
ncbi:MAG: poly-beta-1,6-N-acetyl-D-glucosamine N-deacetylase PgaB [Gammaproteobacteria bacterium]